MLTEKGLHGPIRPVLHGRAQAPHCYGVDPQKVSNKHTSLHSFTLTAKPGNRANIVCDHHKSCSGKVLLGSSFKFLLKKPKFVQIVWVKSIQTKVGLKKVEMLKIFYTILLWQIRDWPDKKNIL